MIISVIDAENQIDDAASAAALLAGVSAVSKSKKTLALQYTDLGAASILDILSGKEIKENAIRDIYSFQDDGLDALLMRAETSNLTKEHFDECATKLLEKENMFDVIKPTTKARLQEQTSNEALKNILISAKSVYDYIFVLLPADNIALGKMITEFTDEDVVLVPQGKDIGKINLSDGKSSILVKDYEAESRFDLAGMRKKYGVKKIYTLPHNVGFRDAVIRQNLLDFILVNRKNIKDDDNYPLTSSVHELFKRFMSKDDSDDEEEENFIALQAEEAISTRKTSEATILPESAVQEVHVKRGLFRKKKSTQIMINLPSDRGDKA